MNVKEIQDYLCSMRDEKYREFTLPLIPNVEKETFIGVRLPVIKKFAKELDEESRRAFLEVLPHRYHEENILHAIILSNIKDFDTFIRHVDVFLPYVSNWSVADAICNKYLTKDIEELLPVIYQYLKSDEVYRVRYGVKCLMNYYLGDDFRQEHLDHVVSVKLDDYYVKMMVAWYVATGLAKNYSSFVKVLEERRLDTFTHNKAIQKAVESFRVSEEHKNYIKGLKV